VEEHKLAMALSMETAARNGAGVGRQLIIVVLDVCLTLGNATELELELVVGRRRFGVVTFIFEEAENQG